MRWRAAPAAAVLAALAALFAFKAAAKMPDFEVYWQAGIRAVAAEPLYREDDGHYQLKYLPAFAILAVPAALLPLPVAKAAWFALSAALIPVLLGLSLALLPERRRPASVLSAATLLLMAKFYGHELVLGQVNLLLAVLVLAAVHQARRGRDAAAGLLVALAVIIKPYAIIFVPWFAARRALRPLAFALVGIAAALVSPAALYGTAGTIELHEAWWRTVTQSTAPNLLNADNVSLAAMYAKWMGTGSGVAMLAAASAAALLAVAAVVFLKRRPVPLPDGLEAALLMTLIPLLSPQGWDYVFLLATPAVMYLVNYDRQLPRPARAAAWLAMAAAGFSLYDVMGRAAYARFMAWSAITLCFVVVVGALALLRMRRVA